LNEQTNTRTLNVFSKYTFYKKHLIKKNAAFHLQADAITLNAHHANLIHAVLTNKVQSLNVQIHGFEKEHTKGNMDYSSFKNLVTSLHPEDLEHFIHVTGELYFKSKRDVSKHSLQVILEEALSQNKSSLLDAFINANNTFIQLLPRETTEFYLNSLNNNVYTPEKLHTFFKEYVTYISNLQNGEEKFFNIVNKCIFKDAYALIVWMLCEGLFDTKKE
jgi:hypothetical protein